MKERKSSIIIIIFFVLLNRINSFSRLKTQHFKIRFVRFNIYIPESHKPILIILINSIPIQMQLQFQTHLMQCKREGNTNCCYMISRNSNVNDGAFNFTTEEKESILKQLLLVIFHWFRNHWVSFFITFYFSYLYKSIIFRRQTMTRDLIYI